MGAGRYGTHLLILGNGIVLATSGCATREPLPINPVLRGSMESPAMCPWRNPQADRQRFFPGSTDYTRETLILSSLRLEIQKRLGRPPESNALYAYRVRRSGSPVGAILIRRAAGEFGAIEVVLAVSRAGKVVGVSLQRLREPPVVANALADPKWLNAFAGKDATNDFRPGTGVPDVAPEARRSARAVAEAVQSLLTEFEIAERHVARSA